MEMMGMNWWDVVQMEIPFGLTTAFLSLVVYANSDDFQEKLATTAPYWAPGWFMLLVIPVILEALGYSTPWWLFILEEVACTCKLFFTLLICLNYEEKFSSLAMRACNACSLLAAACLPLYSHIAWAWLLALILLPAFSAFLWSSGNGNASEKAFRMAFPLILVIAVGLPQFLHDDIVLAPWPMANLDIASYVNVKLRNVSSETGMGYSKTFTSFTPRANFRG